MAYINVFKVSQDGTELTLTATPTSTYSLISINLWTEDTFKDYSQAIDFTSLLADSTGEQTVTITGYRETKKIILLMMGYLYIVVGTTTFQETLQILTVKMGLN